LHKSPSGIKNAVTFDLHLIIFAAFLFKK